MHQDVIRLGKVHGNVEKEIVASGNLNGKGGAQQRAAVNGNDCWIDGRDSVHNVVQIGDGHILKLVYELAVGHLKSLITTQPVFMLTSI